MGLTSELSKDLYGIKQLSERDIEQLHLLITDYFAAAYAGFAINRAFNKAVEAAVITQGGIEESSVLFQNRKYPARIAAFMNSVYGHGAELDDGNKKAAGHAGVHLIPAVFALAEKLKSSNENVLLAIATGYEAFIRISSAAQPGLVNHGFHSTGMAGTLACAAACARLYQLDAQGIEDAIALATTMSGGLLSYGDSRPAIKPLNPGKAAENGLFAAMLASKGVRGPEEALEGQNGWFHAVTDHVDVSCLKGGDHLLLHDCYFKIYPSCRHTHCGIDAGIALHRKLKDEDISEINVFIYPNAIRLAGIKKPENSQETKFSVQYTLACALHNGYYGIDDMDPTKADSRISELIEKICLIPDDSLEDKDKGIRGTKVEVIMNDGQRICETVLVPKGDPESPLNKEDILDKLRICAKGQTNDETLTALVGTIRQIKGKTLFSNPMKSL